MVPVLQLYVSYISTGLLKSLIEVQFRGSGNHLAIEMFLKPEMTSVSASILPFPAQYHCYSSVLRWIMVRDSLTVLPNLPVALCSLTNFTVIVLPATSISKAKPMIIAGLLKMALPS